MPSLAQQPWKGLFFLVTLVFNLTRLPIWVLQYSFPFLRQHPQWSFREALGVRFLRAFLYNASIVRMKISESLEPGKEGNQWSILEAAPAKYYTGIATKDSHIQPLRIGGTWYPKPLHHASADDAGYVVLHFHGGAFVIGDGRIDDAGFLAKNFLKNAGVSHIFCPQYRLAANGGRFPAHLQDAISSYHYLVGEIGINPSKIILSGDSAGGNIVLALLRYIAEYGEQISLQTPGCAWLWSPWVGPKGSFYDNSGIDKNPNAGTDYITDGFGAWGARCLAPSQHSGLTIEDPYINPVDKAFATSTPMFVSYGEREVLLHEGTRFYENMSAIKSNNIQFHVQNRAPHDIVLTSKIIGFEKEARDAATEAGQFLKQAVVA